MRTGDTLVIVAHGSLTSIGTSHGAVDYTAAQLATYLVTQLGIPDQVHVVIAACYTDQFARNLQTQLGGSTLNRARIACLGQTGAFSFSSSFRP
jgi:hypothetical protein